MEKIKILYRDRYFLASPNGDVYNLHGTKLAQHKNSSGYLSITDKKLHLIHRVIATAFIPNPENKPFVNHKDGNKLNNSVDNLEWVTKSENELHSVRVLGNKRNTDGLKANWLNPVHQKPVSLYHKDGSHYMDFDSLTKCAKHLNCITTAVSNNLTGRSKSVRGYKAVYKTDVDPSLN